MWATLGIIAAAVVLGAVVAIWAKLRRSDEIVDAETRRRHDIEVEPTAVTRLLEIRVIFREDGNVQQMLEALHALYKSKQLPNYILDMSLDIRLTDASPAEVLNELIAEINVVQHHRLMEAHTAVAAAGLNALYSD